jgi:hypothetical protein
MIYSTPYRTDKNLGKYYNDVMRMAKQTVCFTDGDTAFLTPDFGDIIENYHANYPDAVLTCRTNRIHPLSKQLDGKMDEECNMRELIKRAYHYSNKTAVTEIKPGEGMSGFLMVVPYKVWERVPFVENGACLGVDSQFRKDLHSAGIKTYIMDGLFVFHTYRLLQGHQYKEHLL